MPDPSRNLLLPSSEWTLGRLLAEGHDAEVYRLDRRTIFRGDKVPRASSVERTLSALRAAQEYGAPVPAFSAPLSVAGRAGVMMELLEPRHLLDRLGRIPWSVHSVGRTMGSVHAALHGVPAPTSLPSLRDLMFGRIASSSLSSPLRRSLESLVRLLPDGAQLLHGDFNPANLLRRPTSRRWLAVDWSGASCGDPAADVAYTLVMIARGALPSSASGLLTIGAPIGRLLLASAYLSEYQRHRALDLCAVRAWQSIWCAVPAQEDTRRALPLDESTGCCQLETGSGRIARWEPCDEGT